MKTLCTDGLTLRPFLLSVSPHSCVSLLWWRHLQSWPGIASVQWILHPGRPQWCDGAAPVWVQGGRAFEILFYSDVTQRDKTEKLTSPSVSVLQTCSHCCPAPLNLQDMCFWLQGDQLLCFPLHFTLSLSAGINSVLCFFREYCKRLHLSDNNTQFLQNFLSLMLDISPESDECECVNSIFAVYIVCHCCRPTDEIMCLFCVSGDQGLIHNLILDSRIIGQLASRVWKNKDLNSWVRWNANEQQFAMMVSESKNKQLSK